MNDDMNLYDEGTYSGNDDYAPVVTMKEWIIAMYSDCKYCFTFCLGVRI